MKYYFSIPYHNPDRQLVPNEFLVFRYEINKPSDFLFKINICCDLFQELMKRGIPAEEAKNLVYEMTGKI